MTKGMVGWAGGDAGPDFFIDSYAQPAKFWGQQHTVFGEIKDDASFAVIDKIYTLPVTNKGMTYLDDRIHFTLAFE
jgi:cyclophilin family peptidyl-prolyl cis-trans isomerase